MARIAMIVTDEFEDSEATIPLERLREAGHEVVLLGKEGDRKIRGKRGKAELQVDRAAKDADPDEFDALVIPGGHSPDHLRIDEGAVSFTRRFAQSGDKLVASVCHGPQLLIEADSVRGRTLASWPSVRKDLENAGATWKDEEVVTDGNFVSSRNPDDLEAFSQAIVDHLQSAAARIEG